MRKRLINYTEEKVEISSRLYSGLVRSLAWKIEYQARINKALDYLLKECNIELEEYYIVTKILRGE